MRSHFSAQTLAEIFRDLYLCERSGVLVLNRDDIEKRIFFERGMILFAESPAEDEHLGSLLVQEGRLSAGALAEARASLEDETAESTPELARALVNRELIAKDGVSNAAHAIAGRVVEAVFRWEGGSAKFNEQELRPTVFEADILSTLDFILRGIFSMAGFEPIHNAMCGLDNRLRPRSPAPIPLERLTLSPSQGFILSRIDGTTDLNEVISILPAGEEQMAARFVFGLLIMGVLEYDPAVGEGVFKVADILRDHADRQALEGMQEQAIQQTYEQLRNQNPHEILGVVPSASPGEIERAYQDAKEQFGKDRILPRVRERYRSELALIESRLVEAYLTVTKPGSKRPRETVKETAPPRDDIAVDDLRVRVEMDKAKSKLALEEANRVADAYYAKARRYMREGDYHNAIQFGKLAISFNQSDARYYFLIAECQSRNPEARWQRMAEENFVRATQLDPWNAEYWVSLGRFYKRQGLNLRAKKQFEEALKLLPSSEALIEELRSVS